MRKRRRRNETGLRFTTLHRRIVQHPIDRQPDQLSFRLTRASSYFRKSRFLKRAKVDVGANHRVAHTFDGTRHIYQSLNYSVSGMSYS